MLFKFSKIESEHKPKDLTREKCVNFSLISHTNVGKTTLARTLLRQDVGEVIDQAHVTELATVYDLYKVGAWTLRLWDTPGFGDTARLLKRLKDEKEPLQWLVSEVIDRFGDRALWCSQQAVKNARENADIVLYLINASESPEDSPYVSMELEILDWIGKPSIILLNQTGANKTPNESRAEAERWREFCANHEPVKDVLTMDAFARCWTQEHILLDSAQQILANSGNARRIKDLQAKAEIFPRLSRAWKEDNVKIFQKSMRIYGKVLANSCLDKVEVSKESFAQKLGLNRGELNKEMRMARQRLIDTLSERMQKANDEVIEVNGLTGKSAKKIGEHHEGSFGLPEQVNETLWSAVGGLVAGAGAGLTADFLAHGLTFGGGAVLGGISGGAGAYLLAKSLNLSRGEGNRVRWSKAHFREQFGMAALSYLAVAHYGRGRGDWKESDEPKIWRARVEEVLSSANIWEEIERIWKKGEKSETKLENMLAELASSVLTHMLQDVLNKLYPRSKVELYF